MAWLVAPSSAPRLGVYAEVSTRSVDSSDYDVPHLQRQPASYLEQRSDTNHDNDAAPEVSSVRIANDFQLVVIQERLQKL